MGVGRVGFGYDIHALVRGRKLILGGVTIPHSQGLAGHSDGDVLLHALVDAVLGAAGAGDIGQYFPSSDRRFKNADSVLFVKRTRELLKKRKLSIVNLDATVVAEKPRLSAYRARIQKSAAAAFGVPVSRVNIKGKTNEGFGDIGRGRAIACYAVASLKG